MAANYEHWKNPLGSTRTQENPSWPQSSITLNMGPERTADSRANNPKAIYPMPSGGAAATVGNIHKGEVVFSRTEEQLLARSPTPMATKSLPGVTSTLNGLGDTSDKNKSLSDQLRILEDNMTVLGISPKEFDLVAQGNHGLIVQISGTGTVTNNSEFNWRLGEELGWDFPNPVVTSPYDETSGRLDDNLGRRPLVIKPMDQILQTNRLSDALHLTEVERGLAAHEHDSTSKTQFMSSATKGYQNCVTGFTDGSISLFITMLSVSLHIPDLKEMLSAIVDQDDVSARSTLLVQLTEVLANPHKHVPSEDLTNVYNNVFREENEQLMKAEQLKSMTYRQLMVESMINGSAFEHSICPLNLDVDVIGELDKNPYAKRIFGMTRADGAAGYMESNIRQHNALINKRKLGVALEPVVKRGDGEIMLKGATC